MYRRSLLRATLAGIAASTSTHARAQASWPAQPFKLILPFAPGGGTDFFARQIAPGMSDVLKQQVIVENRPGGAGVIAATAVKQLPADGYTFLLGDMGLYSVTPALYENAPYDPLKDFAPLTITARFNYLLVVNPAVLDVHSVQELIAAGNRRAGGLDYGTAGVGTTHHLAMEMFARDTKLRLVPIHYRGTGPAIQDFLAGQISLMFLDSAVGRSHIESGKLRAIAAGGTSRLPAFMTVPTVAEQGVAGFAVESWQGLAVRSGTPAVAQRAIREAYLQTSANSEFRKRLAAAGVDVLSSTPEAFSALIMNETNKWRTVIRERQIKPA